jgi:periplasmic divalent cation tolerance protein
MAPSIRSTGNIDQHDIMTSNNPLLALCTCPDRATADRLASALVDEQLAACVNILPGATSVYRWEGRIERESEALLLIKTVAERFDALQERLALLHPYEVPEIIATPITAGLPAYLSWISACTTGDCGR